MKLTQVLGRGFKKLCPQCGKTPVFCAWGVLVERCSECECVIASREDDTWFWMYITTAGITGVFLLGMLAFVPKRMLLARWILGMLSVMAFFGTLQTRKSLAISWDYWLDTRSEHPRHRVVR